MSKRPYDLRDFLSPIWRYSLSKKLKDNPNIQANQVILKAIDKQLNSVEDKTIASKADLYLKTARAEYLDYFGSWFGLERLDANESDDHYRKRLINHIKHPRATIPALRKAISSYLNTNMSKVHIYEPWQDVFLTNDYASRTNGRAHIFGNYYRPAVINIYIDHHFDPGVIDYINWFRPVGVVFLLTYESGNDDNSSIWKMPSFRPVWHQAQLDSYIGFDSEDRYDLNFLDPITMYGKPAFYVSGLNTPNSVLFDPKYKENGVRYKNYLPLSRLNSTSILVDPVYFGKPYYSYLSELHSQMPISNDDTIDEMLVHSRVINPDLYPKLNENSGLTLTIKHSIPESNLLSNSENLIGRWKRFHGTYLAGISDKGKSVVKMTRHNSTLSYTLSNLESRPMTDKAASTPFKVGHKYWINFDLRTNQPTSMTKILVNIGKDQKLSLYESIPANHWVHCKQVFTYTGNPVSTISFVVNANNTNPVYLSSPYLADSPKARWAPSSQDLGYPKSNPNSEYVYAFLNVWAFYFKYVESYSSVEQKLGINPTPQALNQYISDQFNQKYFGLTYKPLVKSKINTRFWFRDFTSGSWQNYASHLNILGNHKDTYNFRFGSILRLLNNKGMMAVALQVPAFHNNYDIKLYYLGMSFGQFHSNKASIKMYKPYPNIEHWCQISTWNIFKWANHNHYDMRTRAQAYYPIRYIRNYIRNVSYGNADNDQFIMNDSILNGRDLIADYQKLFSKPSYYIKPYWNYSIIPSLTDNGNPVKSVSILGVSCGDNYPTNRLNNLLKNSVFGYFSHPIWGHSKSVYMKKDINSEHVWFNNQGSKLWTSTDNIGSRNNYVLTFNARTKSKIITMLLKIELISNDYEQVLTKRVIISSKRHVYNVEFNTYGVFPDTVRFTWEYIGTDIERFKYLKHYKDTFSELKQNHYTFDYIYNHMIPKSAQISTQKVNSVVAFKRRPDNAYMPSEPCYVYNPSGSNYLVPAPKKSFDITDGWNFNGNLPENYYPALFKQNNKVISGYVHKSDINNSLNSSKYLSLIPDGHGDYALGYNFVSDLPNWTHAFMEDVATGKFVKCYGPKEFTYTVTPNQSTSEVMFRDIACHLMARVNVDGKDTSHIPPQVNFKGQDTVAYNDVIFGQPINENNLGETFGDLNRYKNNYSELEQYGINYEDLLDHTLLNDNDMTWEQFAKNNITWQEAQDQSWLWEPLVQSTVANLNLPKDSTSFEFLKEHHAELFTNLLHYKNSFNNFKVYGIDFKDLKDHYYDDKGNPSTEYTFDYAKDNNWLFADGEPFDRKEHCVTVDLGRVYTNIDHLLVQHGSDSLPNTVYDSCVQTSIDGKHWHTWYDNYKGDKYPLDEPYIEPKGTPVAIPVAKYDCFNDKRDFDTDWKLPEKNYVSSHLTHYPVKELSSLLFNDDRAQSSMYLQKCEQTDHYVVQVIPSLQQMLKYKLNEEQTNAYANNIGVPDDSKVNQMDNSSYMHISSYLDTNSDTSSNNYYPKVPIVIKNKLNIPKVDKNNLTNQTFSTQQFQPSIHTLGANINYQPINTTVDGWHRVDQNDAFRLNSKFSVLNGMKVLDGNPYQIKPYVPAPIKPNAKGKDAKKYKKYSHNIFHLNSPESKLNSWYVLQDGYTLPAAINRNTKSNNHAAGTIPNPKYSYYNYDVTLFKFNLQDVLLQNYPNLYQNMQNNGINNPRHFVSSLIDTCTDIYISVKGQINNAWNMSVWDFKTNSWQKTVVKHSSGLIVLHLDHFSDFIKDGNLYTLVLANDLRTDDQPTLHLSSVNLKVVLNMHKVNEYNGGMYPHKNYEYNTNHIYSILPSRKQQIIEVPWVYKAVQGHKVTVSFNLYSSTDTGKFNLKIGNLQSGMIPVEKGHQAFHFVYDISGRMKGKRRKNITPKFVIAPNNGNMKIFGLKAEIGVHLSPYVFPRN